MDNIEKIDLNNVDWQSSREFFDSLKDELEKLDDHNESYDFTWVGKRKSIIEAGTPINKTLRPDVEASKDFDSTKNMLIVGDNLDALKILQESYLGQVKMIYVDPPYNTGRDFVYHDNFTVKKDEYEDDSVSGDGDKIISEDRFIENSKANGRFHSDWLSMIYPRFKLARNLLSDDGVIFISIDDNEQANLKKVCDEVFGEENFVGIIPRMTSAQRPSQEKYIAIQHDYVVIYVKNDVASRGFYRTVERENIVNAKTDDIGRYFVGDTSPILASSTQGYSKGGDYDFEYMGTVYSPIASNGERRRWLWTKDRMEAAAKLGILVPTKNGLRVQNYIDYEFQVGSNKMVPKDSNLIFSSYDLMDSRYTNQNGTTALNDLGINFSFSKPKMLVNEVLKLCCNENSLILDFFAGSGTTGHAVMDLNAEDGGNRRYILVQLPEETNEKSEARKAGYETIDQITAERLRRAGDKVQKEHPDAKVDTGFRVFRIDDSNEKENIRKPLEEYTQETMLDMVDNLKPDRTPLDLLFGAVYASALPFDLRLETRKIGDNTVYLYGYLDEGSGLIACFDDNISDGTVKEIAKLKPLAAVFKDSSFADSAAKINLSEHFRILSVDTKVKVI